MKAGLALLPLVSLAIASEAQAEFPSVNAHRFTPPTDPAGSLYLEPTPTPGSKQFNAALWFDYGWRPSVLRDQDGKIVAKLVSSQVTADVVANIGIGQRFALGFDCRRCSIRRAVAMRWSPRCSGRDTLPAPAFGDLALVGKANLLSYSSLGGLGLSAIGRFTLGTGATASYLSEGAPTGEVRLLGEYKLVVVALQVTAGFKGRFEQRDVLTRHYGHEVPWGAALSVRPQAFGWDDQGRWTWVAEVHGSAMLPASSAVKERGLSTAQSALLPGFRRAMR